jgi:hypothetical protein
VAGTVVPRRRTLLPLLLLLAAATLSVLGAFYLGASLRALRAGPVASDAQVYAVLLSCLLLSLGLGVLIACVWHWLGRE